MNDLSALARRSVKDISILIPSRRPHLLKRAIESLIDKTKNIHALEIIIRLDNDDQASINAIADLPHDKVEIMVLIGGRYGGYKGTGFFFNEMAAVARGEFLCLFGDDVLMQTEAWDKKIMDFSGQQVVVDNGKWQFPAISRKVYEKLGHLCLGAHPDTWIHRVVKKVPELEKIVDIQYAHDRFEETGRNKDEVYEEKAEAFKETKPEYSQLVRDHLETEISKFTRGKK